VVISCEAFFFAARFVAVSMQLFSIALSLKIVPLQVSQEKAAKHKSQFLSVL